MLILNEKVLSEERQLVNTFNEYFSNIVSNLDIQRSLNIVLYHDPVFNSMKKI